LTPKDFELGAAHSFHTDFEKVTVLNESGGVVVALVDHTIASHVDTTVTGAELDTIKGLTDNAIVAGEATSGGVQERAVFITDDDAVYGGKSLVIGKSDDYTLLVSDSGRSFPQTGAAKTFSLPADTSTFKLGWFVTLYAPESDVVTVDQLATADATIISLDDATNISAKGAGVLELVDDSIGSFVFRLSGSLE
jgi:hypothetical protein